MRKKSDAKSFTPWFAAHIKPSRIGVYEVDGYGPGEYQYWDGKNWHYGSESPRETALWAAEFPGDFCCVPHCWRGLAVDPLKD